MGPLYSATYGTMPLDAILDALYVIVGMIWGLYIQPHMSKTGLILTAPVSTHSPVLGFLRLPLGQRGIFNISLEITIKKEIKLFKLVFKI